MAHFDLTWLNKIIEGNNNLNAIKICYFDGLKNDFRLK